MRGAHRDRLRLLRGDGNFYAGDTGWHRDVFRIPDGGEAKTVVRHLKIALYLDPLGEQTGALRVIPGSHHLADTFAAALDERLPGSAERLGVAPQEVPAVALSVRPGDVVMFDHRIEHASLGGGPARRMFALNFFARCESDRQREPTARVFTMYGERGMSRFFSPEVTVGAPAERTRRLEPALQFEAARAEGYERFVAAGSRAGLDL